MKAYEETQEFILKNNINDEDEQVKLYYEIKNKNLYNKYLENMKISKPSYFENYKLFEHLKI
jgi:galactose-1-phosphate uridylyltransferase